MTADSTRFTFEKVRFGEGDVAIFTVHGKGKLNLLGRETCDAVAAGIRAQSDDSDIRCAVLQGESDDAFIGGADLKELQALEPANAADFVNAIHHVCSAIREFPVPVIARIGGYCLGAGLEIAAACDFRICDGSAKFGMPEVKIGVPSVVEAALLPQLIGWGKTRELVYRGNIIDAKEALRIGLVEHRVTDVDRAIVESIMDIVDAAPGAVRLQKSLCREWETLSWREAIDAGLGSFAQAYQSDEPRRYTQKFFDNKQK